MEDNAPRRKIKWKITVFDIIIICLALAAAAIFLLITSGGSAASLSSSSGTVRYTIELQKAEEGTGALVKAGDVLIDSNKNYTLGTVESVTYGQDTQSVQNSESGDYIISPVPGKEYISIVVESESSETEGSIVVGGGFAVRAGADIGITGPGYAGSGYIVSIERSGG